MEIVNFFETLAGKWFSQRTIHNLASQSSQAGQSNLLIEFLPATDGDLAQVCTTLGHDPGQIACGLRIHQDSQLEGESQKIQSSALMVMMTPTDAGDGVLVQAPTSSPALQGSYRVEDDVLTIMTPTDAGQIEERLWFANPNLRMRTSVLKIGDDVQIASFCSEIRMGVVKPAA
ncbi:MULTISPECIES: phycobiliprotein lyase [Cyanophyceae]|uniref:phycobiliprotein lyase n=1 Tax=Cyanophyceae TaxID=3028117 RepID=UPI0016828308|nr:MULTISPECIES: phycobiliprotein lyase [Cyanophyceae]MBD1918647.1 phycobiliprotein lyase [Phormidium sp. FACHB-77]MBD2029146.1 phycobiliprotein lyase [Phormidium sp. FACHB-322]MBD2051266.1 phycobiliprotein lyase [Leptolyngbya sp. FACHB-60]